MAQIIDLNELVPEDITIRYGRPPVDYKLQGDMSVEAVFRLFEMFRTISSVTEGDDDEVFDQLKGRFGDIREELLKLFQVRQPDMTELPFGIRGIGALLQVILQQLGVSVSDETPTPPSPRKKAPSRTVPQQRQKR